MTEPKNLAPCPACGSDNLAHVNPPDAPTSYYHVWCKACMLAGPQSDPSAAKWQALPRTSGDGARLRKLREWLARPATYSRPCSELLDLVDRLLAEPEPQPVPAVAPVAVPSHVREWCRWAVDHYGPTDPEGANEGAVARWVLSLSLPTAPPAGAAPAAGRSADEVERLRKELHEATGVAQAMEQRYEEKRAEVDAAVERSMRASRPAGEALLAPLLESAIEERDKLRAAVRTLACELAAAVGKAVGGG